MSGLLYVLYTNEVPKIHEIMKDEKNMKELTGEDPINFQEIKHGVINFVDDSNSVISFENAREANKYLDRYFKLLKGFYNMSKLKLIQTKPI